MIGIQYIVTTFFFFFIGGLLAMGIRAELAQPGTQIVDPQTYNGLFSLHAAIMIFLFVIPVFAGIANYVLPLMLGAPDMAFPRLNMFGYWAMIPAIFFVIMGFFSPGGGPAAGWTAYPPLSTIESAAPGSMSGQTYWLLALTWVGSPR